jgi:hypothetical protein
MRNTADVTDGKPIAVLLQSISGVSAINTLVAFYEIHGGKRGAILLFCPGHHTRLLLIYHLPKIVVICYCLNGLLPLKQIFRGD